MLGAAERLSNREPARRLGATRPTVSLWRKRFGQAGMEGLLRDAPRPGRHKQIRQATLAKILRMSSEERPREATHGSTRTLAERCGVSHRTVHCVGKAYSWQPHRGGPLPAPHRPRVRGPGARHRGVGR